MKKYMKIASLSLSIILGTSAISLADDPWDLTSGKNVMTASGAFMEMAEDKEAPSALSTTATYVWSSAALAAKSGYYVASKVANNLTRYAVAYGTSYVGVELLMEGTALSMYYGGYAIGAFSLAGPGTGAAAGLAAYTLTTTVLKGMHMIPGMHGALSATYTPVVRPFTDMAIDHGPAAVASALSTGYSTLKSAASLAQSGLSRFYDWYNG